MEPFADDKLVKIGMGFDRNGTVYKKEGMIIRTINPKYEQFCKELLEKDIIKRLISKGLLIQSEPYTGKIQGFDLVLRHPAISFVSYPFEWTPSMIKDAAILMLELNISLMECGLCTQDGHAWNILFDGSCPVFVDFTSIIEMPKNCEWPAFHEFHNFFSNTLSLMEKGHNKIARLLNLEMFTHPEDDFVINIHKASGHGNSKILREVNYLFENMIMHNMRLFKRYVDFFEKRINRTPCADINSIKKLLKIINGIDVTPKISEWSKYYSNNKEHPFYDGSLGIIKKYSTETIKHSTIERLIKDIKPRKVLDVGCNRGLYSQIAALNGAKVVGIDLDEFALDQMYIDSKRLNTHVMPLYVNAVAPLEAVGFKEYPFPVVTERLKSELVICLELVHHLVFNRTQMKFDHIIKALSAYSTKYLIVEFIPKEDKYVAEWYNNYYYWYNENNFKLALSQHFKKIESFDSFPSPRKLLFCEK